MGFFIWGRGFREFYGEIYLFVIYLGSFFYILYIVKGSGDDEEGYVRSRK